MKGKFDEFDKSGSNHQTKTTQNQLAPLYLFNLLYEHCIE